MADRQLFTAAVSEIDPIADLAPPTDGLAGSLVRSTETTEGSYPQISQISQIQKQKDFFVFCFLFALLKSVQSV